MSCTPVVAQPTAGPTAVAYRLLEARPNRRRNRLALRLMHAVPSALGAQRSNKFRVLLTTVEGRTQQPQRSERLTH